MLKRIPSCEEQNSFEKWLIQVKKNDISEIQQFIKYIRTDIEVVQHVLSYSRSNRLVKGHVNRLKIIK